MLDIKKDVILAPFTTFRIGGVAKFLVEVKNEEEIEEAVQYAIENNLNYFILGGGSNILVSDNGFNGLVIKIHDTKYIIHDTAIECGAGLPLSEAVKNASDNSLSGLEWAAGILGTIGGAVRGNAGAFGGSISDTVEKIKVLAVDVNSDEKNKLPNFQFPISNFQSNPNDQNSKIILLAKEQCGFGYRDSIFKKYKNLVILSVTLGLTAGNKEVIQKQISDNIANRIIKQPKGFSAGSFFTNPVVHDPKLLKTFQDEIGQAARNNMLPAGWLIEMVGLRGFSVGGSKVSDQHGNFVLNTGSAKAEDVLMLASIIKQRVRDELGVQLTEEIQLVGF